MPVTGTPRHLLACTDGSPRARKAIAAAAKLAGFCEAKLTVLFVIPPYVLPAYGEAAQYIPGVTPHLYRQRADALAKKVLAPAARLAKKIGIECETAAVNAEQPWTGILHAARKRKCDLIVMASHGRRGIAKALLGSETQRVLTHSRIPVLVIR
jgi:nucleotide-binding universal stress UspA family protein